MLLKSSHPSFGCGQVLVPLQISGLKILLICIQNSFAVAKKLLKDLRKEARWREDWLVRWNYAYCRFTHSSSRNLSCPERMLSVLKTISLLGNSLCFFTLFISQSYFVVQLPMFVFEFQQKIPNLTISART